MTVREMIEQLQRFDPNFRVKIENDNRITVYCPVCSERVTSVRFEGAIDRVSESGDRCEVILDFV